jgi:hypothetical protein
VENRVGGGSYCHTRDDTTHHRSPARNSCGDAGHDDTDVKVAAHEALTDAGSWMARFARVATLPRSLTV